jgi:hypothetical protein
MHHNINHPIFVVGLARSGTKLLRNLIANHPQIFIPPAETNFFAYFIRTVAIRNGRLRRNQIDVFKRYFYNSVFYYEMRFRGFGVSVNELEKCLSLPDWPSIFSCIIRTFIPASEKDAVAAWGDKTPVYLNHMLTLKKAFPSARFIHIVRDPRDRALSVSNA